MRTLEEIGLHPASVPRTATFLEAAEKVTNERVETIAVLDADGAVVGLFGGDEVLRGIFPRYLTELRHTAFAADDVGLLRSRIDEVSGEPVERHMRAPVTVDIGASAIHLAERFLHCDFDALAVVEAGRFAGMVRREEFCRAMLRRA